MNPKINSILTVAKGYALVGASYAKSTANALINSVRIEKPKQFKTEVIRVDANGVPIGSPIPKVAAPIAKPATTANTTPVQVVASTSPIVPTSVAKKKSSAPAETPAVFYGPIQQKIETIPERLEERYTVPTQLEVVEAELVDALDADHFERIFSGFQRQKVEIRPGIVIRHRPKI